MIVEYIRYALKEHGGDELVAAYGRAQQQLDASPNALAWELARCADDPAAYVLRIEWDSAEGHMDGFRKGPHFRDFLCGDPARSSARSSRCATTSRPRSRPDAAEIERACRASRT